MGPEDERACILVLLRRLYQGQEDIQREILTFSNFFKRPANPVSCELNRGYACRDRISDTRPEKPKFTTSQKELPFCGVWRFICRRICRSAYFYWPRSLLLSYLHNLQSIHGRRTQRLCRFNFWIYTSRPPCGQNCQIDR